LAASAAKLGTALTRRFEYGLVVSSGPPHASHEAARLIAQQSRLPLVLDMRDPWAHEQVVTPEVDSPTWRRQVEKLERRCIDKAQLVVVTTDALRESLERAYPNYAGRFVTIMNGADDEPLPPPRHGKRFVIGFAGSLYVGRDPRGLFRAVRRVITSLHLTPDDFGLEFIGGTDFEGVPLVTIAAEQGIADFFRAGPNRPRAEALEFLASATMLVSLPQHVRLAIPAKVFEYTQFTAWLLALAEADSATARLLRGTSADVVDPDDEVAIATAIETRYREFRAGARPVAVNHDGRFDRRAQAERLLDMLERIGAPAGARGESARL
jgi:hypothetical protein